MINMRVDYPLKQDVIEKLHLLTAQIKDLCNSLDIEIDFATKEKVLMTKDEVIALFRGANPPTVLKKIRAGNKTLYDRDDVYEYINSKKA